MRLSNGEVLLGWPLGEHIITAGWTYNDGSAHNAPSYGVLTLDFGEGKSHTNMPPYLAVYCWKRTA